ncbi:ribonucleases P/MRP protein subunit POP1 [Episyrphus balteatus]|uniref:ribonucleases P/MRP protein subunit POP1 n=1 Tax=Episyrphus balteatus TaxID=286459 RepID=UPI002484FE4E|nr:ribonucleases P/MRP protein subunit POP1 [Episyrphus balteatus]
MTTNKLEYDSSLGGPVVLPTHLQTFRYAAASINEIKGLLDEIRHPTSTKLVFQTLPKHMRRRAMSHHPKRLPRKYRSIHNSQMAKAGKPPQTTKRPSRKYRRKPSNLLKEYIRRQKSQTWLETHIWHAKRFHMISKWGYKLPYASCDKTYRSCYRASAKHCLLQDISFYACLEIQGGFEEIVKGFGSLTSSKCGLGIGAKTFASGRREGSIELFQSGQYPNGSMGKVSFLWKPQDNGIRILWIFIHPSAYNEILKEIIKIFDLKSTKTEKVPIESENDDKMNGSPNKKKALQLQFVTKTFAYQRAPKYQNESKTLSLVELKDTMNRFRLTGPLSQAVLGKAFKVKPIRDSEPENWFKSTVKNKTFSEAHLAQEEFWKNCQGVNSPGELLSNMILGLNIEDPRINRPKKRTKSQPENIQPNLDILFDSNHNLHQSRLWDFELRNQICSKMMSTHEFCSQREKNSLVPGERCQFEEEMQPVPLMLIQRPGSQDHNYKRLSYACGWDVIVPSGYGMSVWLSLIMCGAKPGGLREFESIQRELGTDQFLPDSLPGIKESAERQLELRVKYFRKPPNKRCNYRKNSICSPFKAPLGQLIREWSLTDKSFFILRDKELLKNLHLAISQKKSLPDLPSSCLIQINLRMKTRGCPGDFAIICLPTNADFKRNLKRIKFEKNDPIYTEPLQKDPNEAERKKLRQNHKKLLKRMRGRRVREKRRKQEKTEGKITIRPANTSTLVMEQYKKMCELWLPENSADISIRNQCSREVFGYVTRCEFSYIEATVAAIGYVTVPGLQKLMSVWKRAKGSEKMVLVRGTKSRHYRFASFKINCEI